MFSTGKGNLRQFVLEYSDKSEEYVGHIIWQTGVVYENNK